MKKLIFLTITYLFLNFTSSFANTPAIDKDEALALLQRADQYGLNNSEYVPTSPEEIKTVLIKFFDHLVNGHISPLNKGMNWHIYHERVDVNLILDEHLSGVKLVELADKWAPPHPQYQKLQRHLRSLLATHSQDTLKIEAGKTIHPGESDQRILLIRQKLNEINPADMVYDPVLVDKIKALQETNGLEADGNIGPKTLAILNQSQQDKIDEIRLSMERWRWMPRDMGEQYVLVNIPGYFLNVYENNQPTLDMRVIVGKPSSPSPVFSADMTNIVFNPPWYVPTRIARNEILPKLNDDPNYLENHGYRLSYIDGVEVLRQTPGAHNALGHYKFNLPNNFTVYLHDTSSRQLFQKTMRSLSHGCIRVEKPFELAQKLLTPYPEWSGDKIQTTVKSGRTHSQELQKSIPVYIFYATAWVNDQDQLLVYQDIYNKNKNLSTALNLEGFSKIHTPPMTASIQ